MLFFIWWYDYWTLIGAAWYVTGFIGAESLDKEIQIQAISFVYPSAKTLWTFYVLSSKWV